MLLDTVTYRFSGHSPSDASSYREKDEVEAWQVVDPLVTFAATSSTRVPALNPISRRCSCEWRDYSQGLPQSNRLGRVAAGRSEKRRLRVGTGDVFQRARGKARRREGGGQTFARRESARAAAGQTEPQRARRGGYADPEATGRRHPRGLFEAIIDRFYTDPTLIAYGEENRDWGGAFAVYRGLTEALPYHRLFNSPISEGAIVGTAVGYALKGGRARVELMYCDFMGRAGDEIFNQLAKWQAMSGGLLKMPVVLRVSVGSKYAPSIARIGRAWWPYSRVESGVPGDAVRCEGADEFGLFGDEPGGLFRVAADLRCGGNIHPGGVPSERYEIPFGEPDVKKIGEDLTILSIGATLYRALDAAKQLQEQHGISCEVIDARSIVPFDFTNVIESVEENAKDPAHVGCLRTGQCATDLRSEDHAFAFDELDAPPVVVGARNWITPADEIEDAFFPQAADVIDAVHEHLLPLKGFQAARECSTHELMRRSSAGV